MAQLSQREMRFSQGLGSKKMTLDDFKHFEEGHDVAFRNSKGKEKPAPQLPENIKIADTHCHLGMLHDVPYVLARAAYYGIDFLQCICDPAKDDYFEDEVGASVIYESLDSWLNQAQQILNEWEVFDLKLPIVRIAPGVHPHNASDWNQAKPRLYQLLKNPLTSCLGEIGLDYHYDYSPRQKQRDVFAQQLEIAKETGLPVALHVREAHKDAYEILKSVGVPEAGAILHCFNLDAEILKPFVEMGCYVAFGGPLTFKKSFDTRAAVTFVPLDKLLTETDSPFMAPEPLRGTECMPCYTRYTFRCLMDCFGYSGVKCAAQLVTPRAIDMPQEEKPHPLITPNFEQVQGGFSEEEFATQLYNNAIKLLNRKPTVWQKA